MMKRTCFQKSEPTNFLAGVFGFLLVPAIVIGMSHVVSWSWDLTVKTPLRIVISSVAAALGCAWLIWFWFFDPFEEEGE